MEWTVARDLLDRKRHGRWGGAELVKTSILVVDPDEAICDLMADILIEEGWEVAKARSLTDVAELFSASDIDLVITEAFGQSDLFDFDPFFLSGLRQVIGDTPVILSSTYPSTDVMHAGDFGLAEVIPKPFEIDNLLGKINRALGHCLASTVTAAN